jgi:hypothetical protein
MWTRHVKTPPAVGAAWRALIWEKTTNPAAAVTKVNGDWVKGREEWMGGRGGTVSVTSADIHTGGPVCSDCFDVTMGGSGQISARLARSKMARPRNWSGIVERQPNEM